MRLMFRPRRLSFGLLRLVAICLITAVPFSALSGRAVAEAPDAATAQVQAETTFANPFLSAEAYRAARPTLPAAELRLTYDRSGRDARGPDIGGKTVLTLASDWAMIEADGSVILYDFRLQRMFTIDATAGTFLSNNMNSWVYFKVMERQNRAAMEAGMRAAGLEDQFPGGCDADTELGVVLGDPELAADVAVTASDDTIEVTCDGRAIGRVELGTESVAPVAFWPTLALTYKLHPTLLAAIRDRGLVPTLIRSTFKSFDRDANIVWDLASAEPVDTPFPLVASLRNIVAENRAVNIPEDLAKLAQAAASGTAGTGPPKADDWAAHLESLARSDPPAAALALVPTIHSFPELLQDCVPKPDGTVCRLLRDFAALTAAEPALRAAMQVAFLDYGEPNAAATVLAAMLATREGLHSGDPNLSGIYGLALSRFGEQQREEFANNGLESDPDVLLLVALNAFPYDPEYWFSLAVDRLDQWDIEAAFLFLDTAMSLPMPEAVQGHSGLQQLLTIVHRIHADFPAFYLKD